MSIISDLKKGNIANLYLFYGEEAYKRQFYKKALIEAAVGQDTINYSAFEGKDINWQEVYDATQTLPFFADRRLVIVENSGKFKAGKNDEATETDSGEASGKGASGRGTSGKDRAGSLQERILTDLPPTTCLAFFEESAAKTKSCSRKLQKKALPWNASRIPRTK